ncbi:MAG: phosphatase [Deltaproteobacteria bacterium]|nr:phosphatase [Deltaproteobacteria bacterium]
MRYYIPMHVQTDLHVHTIASGHAFSTVAEIARQASLIGLLAFGIADHGPSVPGAPQLLYFSALRFLPRRMEGVRVLRGVEANLTGQKGELDIPDDLLQKLDYAMIGYHYGCGVQPSTRTRNTEVLIAAMRHPKVRVVTHPGNPAFPIEIDALVEAAKDLRVALELNNASFVNTRTGSRETCARIAAQLARADGLVAIGSDAHVAYDVGEVSEAWDVASECGVRPEQVVNHTYEGLARFLGLEESDESDASDRSEVEPVRPFRAV